MKGLVEGMVCDAIKKRQLEELKINIDCLGPYIMCAPFNVNKKSFSPRDYAHLESLVK